ncbi:MAG: hypothetical protein EBR17_05145 [Betaproteobacteria bacterium]|nr:hypothetical protein [Betaproteobacteria bacterium]NBX91501.1 hypothetical protein [Betaproteobacteria bacterium]
MNLKDKKYFQMLQRKLAGSSLPRVSETLWAAETKKAPSGWAKCLIFASQSSQHEWAMRH